MRRNLLCSILLTLALVPACGGNGGSGPDGDVPADLGGRDTAGTDVPVVDPGTDGPRPDVTPPPDGTVGDTGADAATDPGGDAGVDATPGDAPADGGADVPEDVPPVACENSEECESLLEGLGACQVPFCSPSSKTCVTYVLVDNTPCGVPDACQPVKRCKAGECVGALLDCDDHNPCTDDTCDPATGCVHNDHAGSCDDGNPCTPGDACQGGECVPGANQCACQGDGDCVAKDDGDKCNGTLVCKDTFCVPDPETVVTCPVHEAAPCMAWTCEKATGNCLEEVTNNGGACEDGNACTTDDLCLRGACEAGPAPDCDDLNPCTDDACDPAVGCTHAANSLACNDGSACTTGDQCVDGACRGGAPLACDDGNACTADSCDPAVGCIAVNLDTACDDANACTVGDRCVGGACVPQANLICNDGNPCTDDSCLKATGCVYKNNTAACDDGNACTTGDACLEGTCAGTGELGCTDTNPCTADSCDPARGCVQEKLTGTACSDDDACTEGDACLGGECVFEAAVDCDDGNPCTIDGCNTLTGCTHKLARDGTACDDGNGCTTGDACLAGECAGVGKVCNDGNPCTDDSCNPETQDCVFTNNTRSCDDGDYCNGKERCGGGTCTHLTPPVCDDGNACTTDTCDAKLGCLYANNTAACEDGNACTVGDACLEGRCVGGAARVCSDRNTCTTDTCDPAKGCIYTPLADGTACDDGLFCTIDDTCLDGACTKTNPNTCDDANVCTDDSCVEGKKTCQHLANAAPCSDGNTCTHGDACELRICQPGTNVPCDQPNPTCFNDDAYPCVCLSRYSSTSGCDASQTGFCWCNPLRANRCATRALPGYDTGCYCGLNPPCSSKTVCRCKVATDPTTCSCVIPLL